MLSREQLPWCHFSAVMQIVNRAATSTSLTSSANPSVYGGNLTFPATVTPRGPTGTVTFADGASAFGTAILEASRKATTSSALLPACLHNIRVTYSSDANYR